MAERKCETCGKSDADNEGLGFDPNLGGIEVWSWTEKGKVRCFCGEHVPKRKRWKRVR